MRRSQGCRYPSFAPVALKGGVPRSGRCFEPVGFEETARTPRGPPRTPLLPSGLEARIIGSRANYDDFRKSEAANEKALSNLQRRAVPRGRQPV